MLWFVTESLVAGDKALVYTSNAYNSPIIQIIRVPGKTVGIQLNQAYESRALALQLFNQFDGFRALPERINYFTINVSIHDAIMQSKNIWARIANLCGEPDGGFLAPHIVTMNIEQNQQLNQSKWLLDGPSTGCTLNTRYDTYRCLDPDSMFGTIQIMRPMQSVQIFLRPAAFIDQNLRVEIRELFTTIAPGLFEINKFNVMRSSVLVSDFVLDRLAMHPLIAGPSEGFAQHLAKYRANRSKLYYSTDLLVLAQETIFGKDVFSKKMFTVLGQDSPEPQPDSWLNKLRATLHMV
jgi:hypothetical protein